MRAGGCLEVIAHGKPLAAQAMQELSLDLIPGDCQLFQICLTHNSNIEHKVFTGWNAIYPHIYIYVSHAIKPDQPTISYTPYCVRVGLERNLSKLSFASSTAIHDYSSHAKVRSMSWK